MIKPVLQEEDHDDPLRADQRTPGNLDGPQIYWNHVKKQEKDVSDKTLSNKSAQIQ